MEEEQDITWFIVGPAVGVVLILIIIGKYHCLCILFYPTVRYKHISYVDIRGHRLPFKVRPV